MKVRAELTFGEGGTFTLAGESVLVVRVRPEGVYTRPLGRRCVRERLTSWADVFVAGATPEREAPPA